MEDAEHTRPTAPPMTALGSDENPAMLADALQSVVEIHQRADAHPPCFSFYGMGLCPEHCKECGPMRPWPCQTITMISHYVALREHVFGSDFDSPPTRADPSNALTLTRAAAAWLLVLVENSVPVMQGGPMDWEDGGRRRAYELLAAAAGAKHTPCSSTCDLGQGHAGPHLPELRATNRRCTLPKVVPLAGMLAAADGADIDDPDRPETSALRAKYMLQARALISQLLPGETA
jgi:hypothetical protein